MSDDERKSGVVKFKTKKNSSNEPYSFNSDIEPDENITISKLKLKKGSKAPRIILSDDDTESVTTVQGLETEERKGGSSIARHHQHNRHSSHVQSSSRVTRANYWIIWTVTHLPWLQICPKLRVHIDWNRADNLLDFNELRRIIADEVFESYFLWSFYTAKIYQLHGFLLTFIMTGDSLVTCEIGIVKTLFWACNTWKQQWLKNIQLRSSWDSGIKLTKASDILSFLTVRFAAP